MAKELPYFKFEPAGWKFGKIQKRSDAAKVAFIDLCCKYWYEECVITLEDAELDFGKEAIDELIKFKVIKIQNQYIRISFLDDQLESIEKTSNINSTNGKISAQKRALKKLEKVDENTSKIPIDKKESEMQLRKQKFAKTIEPYVQRYGNEMCNEFYKYWTEPNKSKTKFRMELEKTWSLERRLETWSKNDKSFKPKNAETKEKTVYTGTFKKEKD